MNGQPDGSRSIGFRRFGVELDFCVLSGGMVKIVFFTIATIIAITVTHHHHHEHHKTSSGSIGSAKAKPRKSRSERGRMLAIT